uniref:FAD/NAD(P)-binding domain-containing protein n=1 Tax=Periophthalmus magnuspinnatus TaxID=409849 RepID=A0A3B4BCI2_9GOBI
LLTKVVSVNTVDKVVKLSDGSLQPYDQLLIATGSNQPTRPLSCPGCDLEGVMLLQSYEDAKDIHTLSMGRKAVVIGTSFIGMEAASYLSDKAVSVAVVGTSAYPFEHSLGQEIGQMTMQMLEEHGVKFYMKSGVSEIREHNGKVKEVVLKDGQVLEADVVILGIGDVYLSAGKCLNCN